VAELKAMVGRTPAEMWVPPAAAVPSITGLTVNTEFAPPAPMLIVTQEPDDTRRALNLHANGMAFGAQPAGDHVGSYTMHPTAVPPAAVPTADGAAVRTVITESPPSPRVDITFEPDDTRGPLNFRVSGAAVEASPSGDHVGSYMLQCVRYGLATMCTMIALTVILGFYAAVRRALAPANMVSAPRMACTDWHLVCLWTQLCQTMLTIARAPAHAIVAARRSPDISMAVVFVIGGGFYALATDGWAGNTLNRVRTVISRIHQMVHSGWKIAVFVCMAYLLVANGDGATEGDLLAYNNMVREHSNNEWLMLHAGVASRMSEMWSNVMVMPAVHSVGELIMLVEADGCDPENAKVIDTGARRSVIRDPACFDRQSCRPAPFRVRGVLGASGQPDFMGNATVYLPVSDTPAGPSIRMEAVTLVDAVCIPACPHDIIAIGPLMWSGASLWLAPGKENSWMRLSSGSYARLFNRAIIFANACSTQCTSTIATASDIAAPFHPPPVAVQHGNQKQAFYMCSGKEGNPTGFAAWWNHLSDGGTCAEFDKVNSAGGDMLLNSSFAPFYGDVRDGVYHSGLLTPPCGQFNPRRIAFPDDRYPILRTLADFGMGVTGLSDKFQRSVDAVNVLAVRVCLVARKMFDLGRPWIIENPPTRSDMTGAFRRFFRVQ
jgi:hypothetical protein